MTGGWSAGRSGPRRVLIGAVVLFWVLLMAQLAWRELGLGVARAPAPVPEAGESWLAVTLPDGRDAGFFHLVQQPETRDGDAGDRLVLTSELRLELLGRTTEMVLGGEVWRAREVARADFSFDLSSAGHASRVAGRLADGQLDGQVTTGGESFPLSVPVAEELVWTGGLGTALRLPVLEVGEEVAIDAFDPLTMSAGRGRVRCLERQEMTVDEDTVLASVLEIEAGGFSSRAWVSPSGEVLRAETPFGLTLERVSAAEALRRRARIAAADAEGAEEAGDLLRWTAVPVTGATPRRGARRLVVRLSLDGTGSTILEDLPQGGGQQTQADGTLLLERVEAASGALPSLSATDPHLAGDAFVQVDHPRIRETAAAVTAGVTDPWQRASRLAEWVFEELEKEPVLSIPSALEVLEQKRGDCNEHTVLFTALARASGLPTRIAIGLVWSDELGGFYYHAWPEVRLERWIALDPTLGQQVADATHLKLLTGGLESWPRLLPYLGRLQIEVLEVE